MSRFLFSLMLMMASINTFAFRVNGIFYNILSETDLTCEVTRYPANANNDTYFGDISIPSEVNYYDKTYRVTSIGKRAFSTSRIESVTIPESVTSIEEGAFDFCRYLTTVSIGSGVKTIEKRAFYNCASLDYVKIDPYSEMTCIGDEAFIHCSSLTSINDFPARLTSIGSAAFYGCKSLTSITIPNGVTSIQNNTFPGCM